MSYALHVFLDSPNGIGDVFFFFFPPVPNTNDVCVVLYFILVFLLIDHKESGSVMSGRLLKATLDAHTDDFADS